MMMLSSTAFHGMRRFAAAGVSKRPAAAAQTMMRHMSVITLSDQEAVEKFRLTNQKSVLYFTAVWCPPCKTIKPIYEDMAKNHPKIAFGKVDVDDNQDAAVDYEVNAVPTFVFFEGDSAYERMSGADAGKLQSLVDDLNER